MPEMLILNVKNCQPETQDFYVFREPAIFASGGQVYSNSLFSQSLGNFDATGDLLALLINPQYLAGIQSADGMPEVGSPSGFALATCPIDFAISSSDSLDWTTAKAIPLGLTPPVNGSDIQPGAFRITTPSFTAPPCYNVGLADSVNDADGVNKEVVLSSFVLADPIDNIDCIPILKYYIQIGSYAPGDVIDFIQASTAACMADFSGGYSVYTISLLANGQWSTERM